MNFRRKSGNALLWVLMAGAGIAGVGILVGGFQRQAENLISRERDTTLLSYFQDGASTRNIQLAANQIPPFTRTVSNMNLFQYQDKSMYASRWGSQNDPKTIYGRYVSDTLYQFPQLPLNPTFGSTNPSPIAVQTLPPFVALRACRKN